MITDVEDYFTKGCDRCARFATPDCSTRTWAEGLAALRAILLGTGLAETVKWGHPCYMHAGRNIAIIGAFRQDFRLTFFNAALMTDPDRVLERQGPNARCPDMIRFTGAAEVTARAETLRSYLRESMRYAEAGVQPPKDDRQLDLPEELVEALDADPELAEAFHALTPGRQKSYILNLSSAKAPATRYARIGKFRSHILAGKGALDR